MSWNAILELGHLLPPQWKLSNAHVTSFYYQKAGYLFVFIFSNEVHGD